MKKLILILLVLIALVFSSCVSYVLPGRYQESSAYAKDYEILGAITIDLPIEQKFGSEKSVKSMAMEIAKEEYPEADDIVDVTIMTKTKQQIFFGFVSFSYKTTFEGNVIKYLE